VTGEHELDHIAKPILGIVVGTPYGHRTSKKNNEIKSRQLRSIKFTIEKHELYHNQPKAIPKVEYWNGQYRSQFLESGSYTEENVHQERYNQIKRDWMKMETGHSNPVDKLEKRTKEKLANAQHRIVSY
jgi:hypothetical protein